MADTETNITDNNLQITTADQPAEPLNISIKAEVTGSYNLAMQQNFVPILGRIALYNAGNTPSGDLHLSITSDPAFFEPVSCAMAPIAPQGSIELNEPAIKVSADFLLTLKERVNGSIQIKVTGGATSVSCDHRITLLAFNECEGYMYLPELISAFIMPNSAAIEQLLAKSATILNSWSTGHAISGYQSRDPIVVSNIAAAIFAAAASCAINYCVPPASFEAGGQKIRFPDIIMANKLGTCLDLSLFFCACLEQAGLNPIIILAQNHAFVGLWLKNESFPLCFIDNALSLRKRVELKEIAVFETTLITGIGSDFATACKIGEQKLLQNDIVGFIDIRRCRSTHILPLPVTFDGLNFQIIPQPASDSGSSAAKPETLLMPEFISQKADEKPGENRIDQWKRKLLDLSLRNKLLNYRETARSIKIICSSLARLEDSLADGREFRIKPLPDNLEAGRSNQAHLANTGSEILTEFMQREFEQRRLYSNLTEAALDKNLLEIFRDARSSLEEGGTNTLYLGLGFLYWLETKGSSQLRAAPIILLPLEIKRNSVKEGFTICKRDEEAQINVTLLEMLKLDFNLDIVGLDPLPLDDHGIDLDKILNTIRHHILELENWEVREEAVIGNFHFRKFLMYKDLELRSDVLLTNKVVNHLVNGNGASFPDQGSFPDAKLLDQNYALDQTFTPLSADSSQMAAVYAAAAGKCFVLHGPPGTGKSQTITNIIAHTIASGKSVLFVSEKAAALNVVYNRLFRTGLAPFCLELHSNKSRKAEVLEQLKKALVSRPNFAMQTWNETAIRLQGLKDELNTFVKALHQQQPNGYSPFQALADLNELSGVAEKNLNWNAFSDCSHDDLRAIKDCLDKIVLIGQEFGEISDNPWKLTRAANWSPEINRSIRELLSATIEAGQSLLPHCAFITQNLGSKLFANSLNGISIVKELTGLLPDPPIGAVYLLAQPDWPATRRTLNKIMEIGLRRDSYLLQLMQRFNESFLHADPHELQKNWENALTSMWPLSWLRKRAVIAIISQHRKESVAVKEDEVPAVLHLLANFKAEQAALREHDDVASNSLDALWNNGNADWQKVSRLISWIDEILQQVEGLSLCTGEELDHLKISILTLSKKLASGSSESELRQALPTFTDQADKFIEHFTRLKLSLELTGIPVDNQQGSYAFIEAVIKQSEAWQSALPDLRNWCQFNAALNEAEKAGLANLISDLRSGNVSLQMLWPIFKKNYLTTWIESISSSTPVLRDFSGTVHNNCINKFRSMDESFLELTSQALFTKLAERTPTSNGMVAANSELGILNREIQKKARHKPLRVLFTEISKLLPRLKPCLLMSPISVAQYLAPDHPPFDLVIFDEASQIPVWDAIGAIARGKDLIVVGDPKQLPPTSFFSRAESQEWEESELAEDLESILDDCLASGLPDMHLNWHYRSQHESLIAFSNGCYYDNRLFTFPAATFAGLGVKYYHLPQVIYDKGKSRTNPGEAKAVVAEVLRRLRDPETSSLSLGIVTFSVAQQTLIEDLLDKARGLDPQLDEFFSDKCAEPVFVKNLESVQGDERDIIIFSICYGPDKEGKVSLNFGPLNKSGGERRLNVAITRARRELLVFTALKPDMISLSKTRAVGVKHLKMFLEFAERGLATNNTNDQVANFNSPFEKAVGVALQNAGYRVHTLVGCSGYRIDMAVVHPDDPTQYLLGIECDGQSYLSADCARERDKLRHAVLTQLGWQLYRVWSYDWWQNAGGELRKMEKLLELLRHRTAEKKAEKVAALTKTTDEAASGADSGRADANVFATAAAADTDTGTDADTDTNADAELLAGTPGNDGAPSYALWVGGGSRFPAASFDYVSSNALIRRMIAEIAAVEGPVSLSQMARRVGEQFGLNRITQRITMRILQQATHASIHIDRRHEQIFFWADAGQTDDYKLYRQHTDAIKRKPEEICPDEIANAAYAVLQANISLHIDDLVKHTAQFFGYRPGQNVTSYMQTGIDSLINTGKIEIENDNVSLPLN